MMKRFKAYFLSNRTKAGTFRYLFPVLTGIFIVLIFEIITVYFTSAGDKLSVINTSFISLALFTTIGILYTAWIVNRRNREDTTGFFFFSIEEEKKRIFSEMMIGFEEYAELHGWNVKVSLDKTRQGKVGLKFTILGENHNAASQERINALGRN